jgi:hypothetical protein
MKLKLKKTKLALNVYSQYFTIFYLFKYLYSYSLFFKGRAQFQLKHFLGVDKEVIEKLRSIGINDVEKMLDKGKTREQRTKLAITHRFLRIRF